MSLDLSDLQCESRYHPRTAHMRTKLALILFTFELARRLGDVAVTVNCVHPGVIATKLLGRVRNVPPAELFSAAMGGAPLAEGARPLVYLATAPELAGVSGQYFDRCQAAVASAEARNAGLAQQLWAASAVLCRLRDELATAADE